MYKIFDEVSIRGAIAYVPQSANVESTFLVAKSNGFRWPMLCTSELISTSSMIRCLRLTLYTFVLLSGSSISGSCNWAQWSRHASWSLTPYVISRMATNRKRWLQHSYVFERWSLITDYGSKDAKGQPGKDAEPKG
ncbi:hypothetical protein BC936DRAFT_147460 [Jimgerdemannia flammicorona]|uniref:Uncharacterized protein n=1 Tax=Jimgerdemannia flammicorona TaxID=994334 RepID=A0A433D589_9FUNG|nr:hypothetical protein BC936DRAFT_147460 [Jimgerdemannia flammicorona]